MTENGEQQARSIAEVRSYLGGGTITAIVSSPLRRCLRTVQLALPLEAGNPRPVIKEKLRERLGVHTCDQADGTCEAPLAAIEAADRLLYQAKMDGRNRLVAGP